MSPTGLLVALIVIGALCAVLVASHALRSFERRRHCRLINSHVDFRPGVNTYFPANSSLVSNSYAHARPPNNTLRNSAPINETSQSANLSPTNLSPTCEDATAKRISRESKKEEEMEISQSKRRKGLRHTMYSSPIHARKSRRQKQIDRTILMNSVRYSPLSAITEFTDSTSSETLRQKATQPSSEASSSGDSPEEESPPQWNTLPANWPLAEMPMRSSNACQVSQNSVVARDSILMRAHKRKRRKVLVEPRLRSRSLSTANCKSEAPGESLPPIPSFQSRKRLDFCDPTRLSSASVDTVSSSLLEQDIRSPIPTGMPSTFLQKHNPSANIHSSGLHQFNNSKDDPEPLAAIISRPTANPAWTHLQPSNGMTPSCSGLTSNSIIQNTTMVRHTSSPRPKDYYNLSILKPTISVSSNIDQHSGLSNKHRSLPEGQVKFLSHSGFAEYDSALEQRNILQEAPNAPARNSVPLPQRPASVAGGNPLEWDRRQWYVQHHLSSCNISNPVEKLSQRRSSSRISSFPEPDPCFRKRQLPLTTEQHGNFAIVSPHSCKSPPENLSQAKERAIRFPTSRANHMKFSSMLENHPIFEPPLYGERANYPLSNAHDSSGIPRPDSDVFYSTQIDFPKDSISPKNVSPQNWPLSPTPKNNIKLNSSPAAPQHPEKSSKRGSPMLPSPALTSAALFPRKYRVRGLRNPPTSGQSSRTASPSPLGNRNAHRGTGDDLRKSIMILRRMTSEGKLLDCNSQIYRNIGESIPSNTSIVDSLISPPEISLNLSPKITHEPLQEYASALKNNYNHLNTHGFDTLMSLSSSRVSGSAGSVWEDESVRADSPEPRLSPSASVFLSFDTEDREIGHNGDDRQDDKPRNPYKSPQGKRLGLTVGNSLQGTPGSLYDRDGFLKEY